MRAVLAITVAVFLVGCATSPVKLYEGAEKPLSEVSVIRAWSPSNGNVMVLKIDGKEFQNGRISHAFVLPGEHVLTVRYITPQNRKFFTAGPVDMKITTKPGHFYVVNATPDFEAKKAVFSIEDKGTRYDPECLIPRPSEPGGIKGNNC